VAISKNELAMDLREYIHDEMADSAYYMELARMAPTRMSKDILMEFHHDEMMHAEMFMKAYCQLCGKVYRPEPVRPPVICNYEEALKQRILAETRDYKKYGEKYLEVCDPSLRKMFWDARTDEAKHAMRIPILLHEMGIECEVKITEYAVVDP
jgi:rubrerythrin